MKINSLLLISLILLSRASTQNTNSINASLNTAKFLEKKGDIDGAISIYQGILEKNPKSNPKKSLLLNKPFQHAPPLPSLNIQNLAG